MSIYKLLCVCAAVALVGANLGTSHAETVTVGDSASPWTGFMNVSELPENGGGFVFGNAWGVVDLVATFDDGAGTITLSPNTIGDPNEFWYQNTTGEAEDPTNPGGPGQLGNKVMEANLFLTFPNESPELAALQADGTLTFVGNIVSNGFTSDHVAEIFIKEFDPAFATVTETVIPLAPGPFSITQAIVGAAGGLGGEVQYGFRVVGENVWITDTAPFGTAVVGFEPSGVVGDFDGNGTVDCADLDSFLGNLNVAATGDLEQLDLDGDMMVTIDDANMHITTLVTTSNGVQGTFPGDLDCDGSVDVLGDAFILVANLGSDVSSYSEGDINFDGTVDVLGDAFALVANLGMSNNPQ